MKVIVNRALCEGNGNCEAVAPDLFRLDDDDELHMLKESIGEDYRARAQAAVQACPKNALSIEE
ncbi:MAG: ferredoxin [Novosphingobium sp.]